MKLFKRLLLLIVIAAAVYLGYFIKQQGTGFVLIQYQEFSVETSVFVFCGFLIILFILVYVFLRSFLNLIKLPDFVNRSYSNYQNKKSSAGLVLGLKEFTEGRFRKAENILIKQASANENSYLNYLLAARAAQLLHADDRRDSYIKKAHEISPDADIAIGLTQAELQLSHHQDEMALATLNQLITTHPKHDFVMRLLSRTYLQLEDWSHLCPLLKDIRQTKSLPEEILNKTEKIAYSGYLIEAGQQSDVTKLETIWAGMPKHLKKDTAIIKLYSHQLINNNQLQNAEKTLREKLNKQFDDTLITLYASFISSIDTDNDDSYFTPLLENCEKWIKNNPHNATLLLTAGKLCTALQLWGKARAFFDSSLSSLPLPDTYLQIALLLEKTDDTTEAQRYYQLGLKFCLDKK